MQIPSAEYDPDNPQRRRKMESGFDLRIFMADEEASIDRKMHPQTPIGGIISG